MLPRVPEKDSKTRGHETFHWSTRQRANSTSLTLLSAVSKAFWLRSLVFVWVTYRPLHACGGHGTDETVPVDLTGTCQGVYAGRRSVIAQLSRSATNFHKWVQNRAHLRP
jgi:hypothetical protein